MNLTEATHKRAHSGDSVKFKNRQKYSLVKATVATAEECVSLNWEGTPGHFLGAVLEIEMFCLGLESGYLGVHMCKNHQV